MEWVNELVIGSSIAHTIFLLAIVIVAGTVLGKVKIAGISLGITWILFVGIFASHFGLLINEQILHFVKDFGLILFVFSIGMQVGPGFFASFKKEGLKLNGLAVLVVLLGVITAYYIARMTDTSLTSMVGVMSGAVTNTPGLGSAQQTYSDITGMADQTISMGYAVAYPIGVLGVILVFLLLKAIFRVNTETENNIIEEELKHDPAATCFASVVITNPDVFGKSVLDIRQMTNLKFVISRIMRPNGDVTLAESGSVINEDDKIYVVSSVGEIDNVVRFIGKRVEMTIEEWQGDKGKYVTRRIVLTKPQLNGRYLGDMKLRTNFGVNVTRVNRSGVDLVANPRLELQMGDRLTVVGDEHKLKEVERLMGNSQKRLREPNIVILFIGILLGVIVGSIPFYFGSIPQPVKLGLAGGTLVVAILIGRFGPHFRIVTYTTVSANLMLRELGISLFLAAVGIGAGSGFVETLLNGGYKWIGYGAVITMIPILIVGFIGRKWCRLDYFTLIGLIAGSHTNPMALSYASNLSPNDRPAVGYTTVYPLAMFLRVIAAQMLIIFAM